MKPTGLQMKVMVDTLAAFGIRAASVYGVSPVTQWHREVLYGSTSEGEAVREGIFDEAAVQLSLMDYAAARAALLRKTALLKRNWKLLATEHKAMLRPFLRDYYTAARRALVESLHRTMMEL